MDGTAVERPSCRAWRLPFQLFFIHDVANSYSGETTKSSNENSRKQAHTAKYPPWVSHRITCCSCCCYLGYDIPSAEFPCWKRAPYTRSTPALTFTNFEACLFHCARITQRDVSANLTFQNSSIRKTTTTRHLTLIRGYQHSSDQLYLYSFFITKQLSNSRWFTSVAGNTGTRY